MMAAARSYSLLVQLEEDNVPILTNKSIIHSQNLSPHITLDKGVFQMTMRVSGDQTAAQEAPPENHNSEEVPVHWETRLTNTTCQTFTLTAGTEEYDEVESLFRATCGKTILKIERIQNPTLWKSLKIKKRDMEQQNHHQNNEKRLFHGTAHDTVPLINQNGFNRSFAGRNAAAYGNGTYFAVEAEYAARDTYSKPNQNGEKFMYLCRVLTGDYALGKQGMITPPMKVFGRVELYNSVVNDVNNPTIFVIFHDSQAYPEYLITFK